MSRVAISTVVMGLSVVLVGCGPEVADARPQWRVFFSTDAPIPQMGDRLLIEIFDDAGEVCSACRRQIGIADPAQWPVSFGIVPPEGGGGVNIRARLYRATVTAFDGFPASDRIIDTFGRLPRVEGVTDIGITFGMSCFGVPTDMTASTTCDPATGTIQPMTTFPILDDSASLPKLGSWAPAQRVDCAASPEPGMVCIPGGVFLLGNPDYFPLGDLDPVPEQLVQLSPFFLDADELTVAQMRELVAQAKVSPPLAKGMGLQARCTYTDTPTPDGDLFPVNCVNLPTARAACKALGKRLSTEAEWEYAAGNLALEARYPWGTGEPCDNAIIGKGELNDPDVSSACLIDNDEPKGPRPGGNEFDVTLLGVRNMGGNVSEWTDDTFRAYTDPICWGVSPSLHIDPRCAGSGKPTARGGHWADRAFNAQVFVRSVWTDGNPNSKTGIRCAK